MSRSKAASAVAALSALVALLSLMKSVRPSRPISSRRCGRPGNVFSAAATSPGDTPQDQSPLRWRPAHSGCCAGRAASRCRRGRRRRRAGRSRARGRRARCRPRTTRATRASAPRRDRPSCGWRAAGARRCRGTSRRPRRSTGSRRVRDQARLEAGVVLHGAVPVEVVGRDVEQHADAGRERGRQLDLERRHLDDVDAALGRRLQLQDGGADVAAHLRVPAGGAQDVGDERRGRRLAVGAGDGDERRIGAALRPLAAEQLDVADDLDARGPAPWPPSSAARDGSAARRAPAPGPRTGSSRRRAGLPRAKPAPRRRPGSSAVSSAATTLAPPAASARHAASPERARPNTATVLPANVVTGVMLGSLSASRPRIALSGQQARRPVRPTALSAKARSQSP